MEKCRKALRQRSIRPMSSFVSTIAVLSAPAGRGPISSPSAILAGRRLPCLVAGAGRTAPPCGRHARSGAFGRLKSLPACARHWPKRIRISTTSATTTLAVSRVSTTATGRVHRVVPLAAHEQLDRDLSRFAPTPYVVPSSGMVVIADVLSGFASADDLVVLAGFGHVGWEWHPFAAERRYVDALAAEGRLRRLSPSSSDLSQGA